MSQSKKLVISYKDYVPGAHIVDGDAFEFLNERGGWSMREDVEGKALAALQHVLNTMQAGDKLTITYEVTP